VPVIQPPVHASPATQPAERERARRFFNRVAPAFHVIDRHLLPEYRLVLRRLMLPADWSVLDLGTGTGTLALACAERGHAVTGIDTAERLLNRARRRLPEVDLRRMDLVDLPSLADGAYDVVAMAYLLHGLPPELRRFTLAEARRLARHRVIIFDYHGRGSWFIRLVERIEGPHYQSFVQRPMEQRLAAANLEILRTFPTSRFAGVWLTRAG